MADGVEMFLSGFEEVGRYLDRVDVKTRDKVIVPALRKAQRALVTAMRQKVPTRFGLLKRSLGVVVKRFRGGRVVWSRAAPRTGPRYRGEFIADGKRVVADPVRYAHLVEFGYPSIGLPVQSFSRNTFRNEAPGEVNRFGRRVQTAIEKIAAKEAKRST